MIDARKIFIKNGAHIGTQRKVDAMRKFIFRIRPDGLAIINAQMAVERIKIAARFIARYPAEDVLVVASKEQAQYPARKFAEVIGAKYVVGRFLPGTLTNPSREYFMEPKIVFVADPYADRQAISEAVRQHLPVISLASTNNIYPNVDLVIPCNNKGRRALAAVYWLLANFVLKERKELTAETIQEKIEDFISPKQRE